MRFQNTGKNFTIMHNVDIRNVSLGQIQYFVKAAEYGNITKASEYFNLSQPTLSKKLKSLEAQLDLQLFVRGSKNIQLTPAGRYLYEKWENSVKQLEEDIQYAHVLQQGKTKSIVIAILDSFRPKAFLLPFMEIFSSKHPDIFLRIESDSAQDIRRMLIHGETDVIFSIYYDFDRRDLDQISWHLMGQTCHCACMRKTNPLAKKKYISAGDLKCADFVSISPQYLPEYTQMIENLCRPFGFAPNITSYVSSANSLTLNLQTDRDVFICDKYYADLNEEEHVLVPIENTGSGFVIAWRKDSPKEYLQIFLDEALSMIEE